jgi:serine/threonine protein kinase
LEPLRGVGPGQFQCTCADLRYLAGPPLRLALAHVIKAGGRDRALGGSRWLPQRRPPGLWACPAALRWLHEPTARVAFILSQEQATTDRATRQPVPAAEIIDVERRPDTRERCQGLGPWVLPNLIAMARLGSRAGPYPPTLIAGRYRIGEVIGRGGMGEVRAAIDERLNRGVAVKILRTDLAEIDEVRRRFEGEALAAAALTHPNVVAVFDAGEEDGAPYIVMERLSGRTLADELATGPLSGWEVDDLAVSVLAALEAAHNAGIVHRDVKPGNVLRGVDGPWKVADFGIARSAEAAGDITAAGVMIGTPAYLAPERIEGQAATPASDVYATGVVLYEALTGRKPFAADTSIGLAEQIRVGRAPALRELVPEVDPTLERVVTRAMATDPRRRFASAADMRRALEDAPRSPRGGPHSDDKTEPRPSAAMTRTRALPTGLYTSRRAGPGRRAWLAVAGVVLAIVVVGIVLWQRDSGTSPPSSPAPSTATAAGQPGVTLPPGLDRALDHLSAAVQR